MLPEATTDRYINDRAYIVAVVGISVVLGGIGQTRSDIPDNNPLGFGVEI